MYFTPQLLLPPPASLPQSHQKQPPTTSATLLEPQSVTIIDSPFSPIEHHHCSLPVQRVPPLPVSTSTHKN